MISSSSGNPGNPTIIAAGSWLTASLMLAIPFSTSITTIISFLLFFLWLLSRQFLTLGLLLTTNPVALLALLLFALFFLGLGHTSADISDALAMLGKYRELLLLIILPAFLHSVKAQRRTWNALFIGLTITLLSSHAFALGILESPHPIKSPTSIKTHITHGLFVAFLAFYCAHQAISTGKYRVLYLALVPACLYNLFFQVPGRSGQLIVLLLALLFSYQRFRIKGLLAVSLLSAGLFTLFVIYSGKAQRVLAGFAQLQSFLQTHAADLSTSEGQRLTFWKHSLTLFMEKPWFGHGTGSFAGEYQRVASLDSILTSNPHNEYLMIAVQLGVAGLLCFLLFLYQQYRCSQKLPGITRWLAQGVLLTLIANSMINSSFLDHTEGHWFACLLALCFAPLGKRRTKHRA